MRAVQAGAHIGGGSAAGGSRTRLARRPARPRLHGRRQPRPQRGKHPFQQIDALSCYAGLRARARMDAGNLFSPKCLRSLSANHFQSIWTISEANWLAELRRPCAAARAWTPATLSLMRCLISYFTMCFTIIYRRAVALIGRLSTGLCDRRFMDASILDPRDNAIMRKQRVRRHARQMCAAG